MLYCCNRLTIPAAQIGTATIALFVGAESFNGPQSSLCFSLLTILEMHPMGQACRLPITPKAYGAFAAALSVAFDTAPGHLIGPMQRLSATLQAFARAAPSAYGQAAQAQLLPPLP